MMKRRKEGKMTNATIAGVYSITTRRLQQLWAQYRSTGQTQIPTLHRPGRPKRPPDPEEEQLILKTYQDHRVCAVVLEHLIQREHGRRIPHNRIHTVLVQHGYAKKNPRKQRRRRWVRYERKHSMSLWHMDWFQIDKINPKLGKWLVMVQDDASRKVMGHGVFDQITSNNSVVVLEEAISRHGLPDAITDKGSTFYAVDSVASTGRRKGYSEFELFLQRHGIRHILGRTNHPQTNGKIERFFLTLAGQIGYWESLEGLVDWYNTSRPHMSLGMATPEEAFLYKMRPERILGQASQLLYESESL
jgi:putative transposase